MAPRVRAAEVGRLGAPGSGGAPALVQDDALGGHAARELAGRFRRTAAELSGFDPGGSAGLTWTVGPEGTPGPAPASPPGRNGSHPNAGMPERGAPFHCAWLCSTAGAHPPACARAAPAPHRPPPAV